MSSIEILDILAVYAPAIVILLLSAAVIFRIVRGNAKNRREQLATTENPEVITNSSNNHTNISGVPGRMLRSSDFDKKISKQNSVTRRMEKLSPLKQGILWAEILGRPGGRRRRNT